MINGKSYGIGWFRGTPILGHPQTNYELWTVFFLVSCWFHIFAYIFISDTKYGWRAFLISLGLLVAQSPVEMTLTGLLLVICIYHTIHIMMTLTTIKKLVPPKYEYPRIIHVSRISWFSLVNHPLFGYLHTSILGKPIYCYVFHWTIAPRTSIPSEFSCRQDKRRKLRYRMGLPFDSVQLPIFVAEFYGLW